MEAAEAVNVNLKKEFSVASEFEGPSCSEATKESEDNKQNENASLNCEGKVFPETEGDANLVPRLPDSNVVSSSRSKACFGGTAKDSCETLERSEDPSNVQARNEIGTQLKEEVKAEDADMEAAEAVSLDLKKEFCVASELESPSCSEATKKTEAEKQIENANLNCEGKVFPETEGDANLVPRLPDSNVVSSSRSEACSGGTAKDSCETLERSGDPSNVQARNEIGTQLKEEVKAEDADMEAAEPVSLDLKKEFSVASELESPSSSEATKKTEEEKKQNENANLNCEGKVFPETEGDVDLVPRLPDSNVVCSSRSEACSVGTAKDSCGTLKRSGDPSSVQARNEIAKQLKEEVKTEDADMEAAEAVSLDLKKEFSVAFELESPCSEATKETEEEKQNQNANLNCEGKVFPETECDVDLVPRLPDSNVFSSSGSEACSSGTAKDSCGTLEGSGDPSSVQARNEIAKQLKEEVKTEDADLKLAVHSGRKRDNSASTLCDSDVLNSVISEPTKGRLVTWEQRKNSSESKTKEMAKQSAGEKCESEDECSRGEVLLKLDKDDSLEAKPCGANLSESSCFEKNCSSAFSESSMHSDSPHSSFSTDVGKHAAEKGEEIDREGPEREAVKEVESEKEEHSSSCERGKQESRKEETHNEGHGSSTIYPIIDAIGKKEENDCEVQESSSVEPLKKKAGEEEIQPGSKHDNHMPSLQSSVEKPDTSSSESHDSQTDVQPSISCEPCSQAADDLLSSKDGENTSFTETSKEETEEESEDEDEQEETCHPYVSQFLHQYIKVGKYVPTSVSKARDFRMKRADVVVEAPSLVTPLLIKRPDYLLTEDENCEGSKKQKKVLPLRQNVSSADEFFESEIGKFFIGLGLSRAREVCNQEVLKLKRREIKKTGGRNQEMIDEYKGLIEEHRKTLIANSAFKFKSKSCKLCDFKTESSLVLEGHLLTPHLTTRRELQCGFCDYATRDSKVFAFHVEAMHNRQAILEPPQLHHQCPFCPFETNQKIKATSHVNRCEKVFSSSQNQRPTYDFQPPGVTAKPLNFNNIMNYEETLFSLGRIAKDPRKGSGATRQNGASALVAPQGKPPLLSKKRRSAHLQNQSQEQSKSRLTLIQPDISSNQTFQVVGNGTELIPLYNESIRQIIAVAQSPSNLASLRTGAEEAQQGTQPQTCESPKGTSSTAPVIACEICDGFVKDLAQLRLHMHRTHSVKIHRATLSQRPPLSCQKCDRRCFSDQGLERHLLGAHGMVTPNMQYMAKRGRDAGRCPRCGRIYAAKMVSHMKEVHRMTVRMATLSYKCPICEAVFAMYGHFEKHVRKVHTNNRNKSSAAVNNGQTSKRPLSAEASTPTIVKYNSSKRPCLPTSSPSTSYQANSVKRPFSAPSSSSATSNSSAAKRPLLSPTTGHFSSAMCPSSAGAPTSALANPSYSVRPSMAASYSSSTSQLNTVKRPFCATDSTATNSSSSFTRLPVVVQTSDNSSASSSAAKWPPSASTSSPGSAGSNFAARPLLPANTTTAVTGSSSSKESTSGVAFIPATAHTKSPMSPFMAQSSPVSIHPATTSRPFLAETPFVTAAGSSSAKQQLLVCPTSVVNNAVAISSTGKFNTSGNEVTCLPIGQPTKQPISAVSTGELKSSGNKVICLPIGQPTKQPISTASTSELKSSGDEVIFLPIGQPTKQPISSVSTGELKFSANEVTCLPIGQPTKHGISTASTGELKSSGNDVTCLPIGQSTKQPILTASTGELKPSGKEVTCLPIGQPTKQPSLTVSTGEFISSGKEITCLPIGQTTEQPFLAMSTDKPKSSVKEVTCLPVGQPSKPPFLAMSPSELNTNVREVTCLPVVQLTKQPFLAKASALTVIAKTTDISPVESNSKSKEISGAWAEPTFQSVLSKIKVERADPMEVAPSASSQLNFLQELVWCVACKKSVEDFTEHLKYKHIRQCRVRVCHIETCDSCLSSFSGLKVAITSDVEDEDSSEEEEEEEDDSGKNEAARPETMVLDRPCKSEPVDV